MIKTLMISLSHSWLPPAGRGISLSHSASDHDVRGRTGGGSRRGQPLEWIKCVSLSASGPPAGRRWHCD